MALSLQILIEGEPLDLLKGEDRRFYISKQLYDLSDLETRNSGYSKTIQIPLTPKNNRLLGRRVPEKARFDQLPFSGLPCDVLMSGVSMIQDAILVIGRQSISNETVSVTVYGGTSKFFTSISNEPLSSLNFSDLDFEWTLDGIKNNNLWINRPICVATCQWYSNKSRRQYLFQGGDDTETGLDKADIGEYGFWFQASEILDRIFANLPNLTVDSSALGTSVTSNWKSWAIAIPVPIIHESFKSTGGNYTEVALTDDPLPDQEGSNEFVQMSTFTPYTDVIENPANYWVPGSQYYANFGGPGFFLVSAQFQGTYKSTNQLGFAVMKNGVLVAEVAAPGTSGGNEQPFSVGITTSVNVDVGDRIEVFYRMPITQGCTISSTFSIAQSGADRGRYLEVSSLMPEMTQRDFVKEIFKIAGVVPAEENGTVTLSYIEDIRDSNIKTLQIDKTQPVEVLNTMPTYASTNILKYTDNPAVERLDANSTFLVNSTTLASIQTAIESKFSATDNTDDGLDSLGSLSVPKYELEYNEVNDNKMRVTSGSSNYTTTDRNDLQAGDYVVYEDGLNWIKRRVVAAGDFNGVFDVAAPNTVNDFDWKTWRYNENEIGIHFGRLIPGNFTVDDPTDGGITEQDFIYANDVKFDNFCTWNRLKDIYYKLITESMFDPFIINAWVIISASEFSGLNELDLVYLEEYSSYFYINKLDQWKDDGRAKIQLIELNI